MKVKMKALREFPMGDESRRLVAKGEEYDINSSEVEFHETTKRGKRIDPPAEKASPAKPKEA